MLTTKSCNENVPFNTGMLVNRIFVHNINGNKQSVSKLRESIDKSSAAEKFAGVKTNAVE